MPQFVEQYQDKPDMIADVHFSTLADADQILSLRSIQRFAQLGRQDICGAPNGVTGFTYENGFVTPDARYEVTFSELHLLTGINKIYADSGEVEGVILDEKQKPVHGTEAGGTARAVWKASPGIYMYQPIRIEDAMPTIVNVQVAPNDLVELARSPITKPIYQMAAAGIAREHAERRIDALLREVETGMPDSNWYRLSRMARRAGRALLNFGLVRDY